MTASYLFAIHKVTIQTFLYGPSEICSKIAFSLLLHGGFGCDRFVFLQSKHLNICFYFRSCLYSLSLNEVENYSVYLNSQCLILFRQPRELFNRLEIKEDYSHQVGQISVLSSLKLLYSIFQKTHEHNSYILYSDHNMNMVVLKRKQNAVKFGVFNQEIFRGYCADNLNMS